jgi:hypothetical protein
MRSREESHAIVTRALAWKGEGTIMNQTSKKALVAVAGAALAVGCTSLQQEAPSYKPLPIGASWQSSQRNTGSYGTDAEVVMTRGEDTMWQGQPVYQLTNKATGTTIMQRPDSKWVAIVAKDGKPIITYDPPLGYVFPLAVGKTWNTQHHVTNYMNGKSFDLDWKCAVEALESVTVKAGTFQAFKIVCDTEWSHDVVWFGKDTSVYLKQDSQRNAGYPSGEGTQRAELVALNAN